MTDDQIRDLLIEVRKIAPTLGLTGHDRLATAIEDAAGNIAGAIENLSHAVGQLAGVLDHHESRRALRR